jgi:hypothetical protein
MVNARAAAARGEYYDPLHPPMDAVELVIVSVLFGVLILWWIYLKKFRLMYVSVWPCCGHV